LKKTRHVWTAILHDGTLIADSSFSDEAHAWQVALGWPSDEEIAEAKRLVDRVVRATITYELPAVPS
jgi:hypothetical protein